MFKFLFTIFFQRVVIYVQAFLSESVWKHFPTVFGIAAEQNPKWPVFK